MKLQIVTPLEIAADIDDVVSLRADDPTGSFTIWPHHADFLTTLAITVVEWKTGSGGTGHVAVRGGILRVEAGERIEIATRQAISGPTLEKLGPAVLDELRDEAEAEAKTRTGAARLHMGLMRQLNRYLQTRRGFYVPRAGGFAAGGEDEISADE
ncbi:F0F1 ATP synthase subunit epsilon [Methyloligella sp. 2.7D]|uniref:F0F1 ATP synthase subunit epsilon n=1 Tax=unclassified Methyloligella TaxID=2625955 RepID=UPI00157C4891|nr:F0F1 ATP synthase subunit epsilon [Methyloligella sp. GL2]QKP78130.1 F0F1 ATP synthase subunit epsilon [Methyloligella sp. GL2]